MMLLWHNAVVAYSFSIDRNKLKEDRDEISRAEKGHMKARRIIGGVS